jgi:ribonuclease HI
VYTDGACLGNPGPGGWAWAVPGGPYASGPDAQTTNQRMEIRAALEAVRALEGPLDVASDSTYVVHCFRDRWWEGWVRNGWVNKAKKPVANQDLWKPLIEEYRASPERLRFRWVKGHSGDAMNDLVDRLAVDAARTQSGRSGVGMPEGLGGPDVVAWKGDDPRVPDGHKVVVAGEREAPVDKVAEVLAAKRQLYPDLVVMTGLSWGVAAAQAAGVSHVMVLPFPMRELPPDSGQVVLQVASPETTQKAAAAYSRRDAWLARHADEAIVVWDGDDQFVGKLVRSLQDHLGEEDVWVLTP